MTADKVFGIVMFGLGALVIVMFLQTIFKILKSRSFTGRTQAEIVEVEESTSVSKGRRYYYYSPVYQYTVNGTVYKKKFEHSTSNQSKYAVGQVTQISYNESKPDQYIPEGGAGKLLGNAALFLLIGGLMIYVGFSSFRGTL